MTWLDRLRTLRVAEHDAARQVADRLPVPQSAAVQHLGGAIPFRPAAFSNSTHNEAIA
ncbi:hypothetical protein [Sphingomonas abaci]|uniref:Uncharacterized protein n=1 Tax=Sphingomonas abaci TaxID=237611 RepID=A0A7W7EXE2_9SPHN|nr:hypothetical protein [Sphingomonas abaci]MBB4616939.1 hypothetical protein [Sphingomonas abaci]